MSRKKHTRQAVHTSSPKAKLNSIDAAKAAAHSRHSFQGILSCLLPIVGIAILLPGTPKLSVLTTSIGVIFVYILLPIAILAGFVIAFLEIRKNDRKHLFPLIGLVANAFALLIMLFAWIVALEVGYPFVCFDKPLFCFH